MPLLPSSAIGRFWGKSRPPSPTKHDVSALAKIMPPLHSQGLEPPSFHKTNWVVDQIFQEEDDPDRTKEAWLAPPFIRESDPVERSAQVHSQEIYASNGKAGEILASLGKALPPEPHSFARVLRNVLGEADCAALISAVNTKGFTPALINIGCGMQQLLPGLRDGHRVIVDSRELADWLLAVIRPALPEVLPDGSRLVELNERMRFLCYTPGQEFGEHYDGCFCRPRTHPRAGDQSRITVQLYLHDVPEGCGGATTFFPNRMGSVKHQPEAGSVLLFTQDLTHEGSLVVNGLKYTLRTEAMYSGD